MSETNEILDILHDARDRAQQLQSRHDPGALDFWRFVRKYSEAALELAREHRKLLAEAPAAAVFSPPVLFQPVLRPVLAPYDLHRFLYLGALGQEQPGSARLLAVRGLDAVIDRVFLGFPEPGCLSYPGMQARLRDPEATLSSVRSQEAFILERLAMSPAEAEAHLRELERGLSPRGPLVVDPEIPTEATLPPPMPSGAPAGWDGTFSLPAAGESPDRPVLKRSRSRGKGMGVPTRSSPPERRAARPKSRGLDLSPKEEEPEAPEQGHYRVWYATTRRPVSEDSPAEGYAAEADPEERVHQGTCDVLIPESHRFGSVGSAAWKRWLRPWRADDRLRIESYARLDEPAFLDSVRRELGALDPDERVALVYIHGFRTSFDEAAIRAAQIGFDLKIPGVTAFFSWHSRGELDDYLTDREAIQEAEEPLRRFLLQFATQVDAEKVHLIAHSMGNQGLARVIQGISADVTEESGKPFGQILLAAPDISQSLFRRLARAYPKVSERTTLYVSAKDKALKLSRWLQSTPRAGFTPPVTVVQDIDTVEVTDIDLTMLGHGYFAAAEAVLYDMSELIHDGKPPERRLRVRSTPGPPPHWVIAR